MRLNSEETLFSKCWAMIFSLLYNHVVKPFDAHYCHMGIRYDTIVEFNMDSKAEYSALYSAFESTLNSAIVSYRIPIWQ